MSTKAGWTVASTWGAACAENQSPHCCIRRKSLPRMAFAARAPRQAMMRGRIMFSSWSSQRRQALISLCLG